MSFHRRKIGKFGGEFPAGGKWCSDLQFKVSGFSVWLGIRAADLEKQDRATALLRCALSALSAQGVIVVKAP